jgi:hypothetical protein
MRTATFPSVRVTPALRSMAESVLLSGETLSTFIESSIAERVQYRQSQKEFIARGQRNAELVKAGAMRTYSLDEVMQGLRAITPAQAQAPN